MSAAQALKRELGIEATLVEGSPGEFTVWVGDTMVAKKKLILFPSEKKIVSAVRAALTLGEKSKRS